MEAILFGQAGFLEENLQDEYHKKLKTEFDYLVEREKPRIFHEIKSKEYLLP